MKHSKIWLIVVLVAGAVILPLVWSSEPDEQHIEVAHITKPPAGINAQVRPGLMQDLFRFPRPFALDSVRLVRLAYATPDQAASDQEAQELEVVWELEPDPDFTPDDTQAETYHRGASVETQLMTIGQPIPGLRRVDPGRQHPLKAMIPGAPYRLEITGEGLSGHCEFTAYAYR